MLVYRHHFHLCVSEFPKIYFDNIEHAKWNIQWIISELVYINFNLWPSFLNCVDWRLALSAALAC